VKIISTEKKTLSKCMPARIRGMHGILITGQIWINKSKLSKHIVLATFRFVACKKTKDLVKCTFQAETAAVQY
jgi:hypothetical protein